MSDHTRGPVSESMRLEEEKAQKVRSEEEDKERERAQKEWATAGEEKYNGQFKKLHYLLEKSTVCTCHLINLKSANGMAKALGRRLS